MQVGRLLVVVALVAGFNACTLQWDVRPDPGDAAAPNDGGPDRPDTADAMGVDVAPVPDAEAGPDCAALATAAREARALAKSCMLSMGQCTMSVKDECDCDVVVRSTSSQNTTDYLAAVAAWKSACKPPCTGCPQLTPPASWACLQTGAMPECKP